MGSSPIRVAISLVGNDRRRFASVAQSVEQGTENPRVGGSIPPGGTKKEGHHLMAFFFWLSTVGIERRVQENMPVACFPRRGFAAAKRFRPEAFPPSSDGLLFWLSTVGIEAVAL